MDLRAFKDAVVATRRKKLLIAGLTNEVCVVYAAISAVEDGDQVQVVIDAGGSPTRAADDAARERMRAHGVTITSTNQILAELAVDWASPAGQVLRQINYEETVRHLAEAP